ncbi:MAG: hypothetical protein ACTTKW_08165, partial [Schwartzia sp. (in: firmicutes)]
TEWVPKWNFLRQFILQPTSICRGADFSLTSKVKFHYNMTLYEDVCFAAPSIAAGQDVFAL